MYLDDKVLIGALGIVALGIGYNSISIKKAADESKDGDCGCHKKAEARVTRGQEVFNSELNQDMSGASADLSRLNPVEVSGSEDVYGAESSAPTLSNYNTEYVNMNPLDYQTPTAFSQYSGYASQPFWDQANDMLPEYRYAMPWSSSYLPLNEWRPNDQQGYPAGPLPLDERTRSMNYRTWQRS
jgi:hypothetical protein